MDRNRTGRDAGKTSGGGSLGHDPPEDVSRESTVRNQSGSRNIPRQGEARPEQSDAEHGGKPTPSDDKAIPELD